MFFGRSRDIMRATDLLRIAAKAELTVAFEAAEASGVKTSTSGISDSSPTLRQGTAFLLVVGMSGAGKSSLTRAGIVPRLTTPGVVKEVDLWRVAIMRPGDGATPVDSLTNALLVRATQGKDGAPYTALPELAESGYRTPQQLASLLRGEAQAALPPIMGALGSLGEAEREREGFDRPVRADLLLVVDQLDDLFAANVEEEDRAHFASLLAAFVATGRIWVVATLRAALYERFLEENVFKTLKANGADYDLSPPGPVELADIVRNPAQAAGLAFERNAEGKSLDEQLLDDAAGADTLPLLQFTLQRLFEQRLDEGGETRLTFAAYDAIGGLDGAIDRAAEDALKALDATEKEALPRLLRQLAVPVNDPAGATPGRSPVTIRTAPVGEAAPDKATRDLVNALVKARILTDATENKVATVRVAHQRVLESWKSAQDIVRSNVDFYRIRSEIDEQRRRWNERARKSELLLQPGLPLAEAEATVARYREELTPDLRAFVALSGQRARRRQRLTVLAAAVFACVAVGALISWRLAQTSLDAATAAISALIDTTSEIVQPIAQLDTVEALIGQARDAINRFPTITSNAQIDEQRARTLLILAEIDFDRGNIKRMREEAEQAFKLLDPLAERGDPEMRHQRARSERFVGLAFAEANDKAAARAHYEKGIAELDELLGLDIGDDVTWRWRRSRADLYENYGDVLLHNYNDPKLALIAYDKCYDDRVRLTKTGHNGPNFENDIAWAANKHGDVAVRSSDDEEALRWFNLARTRIEGIGDFLWNKLIWPEHLAIINNNIALVLRREERFGEADESFTAAGQLFERLVRHDPKNASRLNFLAWNNFNQGENLLRWAFVSNDNDRLLRARTVFAATATQAADVAERAPTRMEWQYAAVRARAFLIAVDALIKQWSGDYSDAAAGLAEAANIMINEFMPHIDQYPNQNFIRVTIEFCEWAGLAAIKGGKPEQGRKWLKRALDLTDQYRPIMGDKSYAAFHQRIQASLDRIAL